MRPDTTALNVEGPYRHGNKFRCRLRTTEGRRWLPAADTIEDALRLATETQQCGGPVESDLDHPSEAESPQDRTLIQVEGPYRHRDQWRYRVVSSAGRQWAPVGRTEREAHRLAEKLAATTAKLGAITIRDAIDAYINGKCHAGARPATMETAQRGLTAFFAGILATAIGRLTPRVCQAQYDALRQTVDSRTGRIYSVSTHRNRLGQAKSFLRWAVGRGWLRENPAEGVQGQGRRRRGKVQLSLDEARKLSATCVERAAHGDVGAVAILIAMLMALRASEILSRVVRDLDDGGRVLRVDDNQEVSFWCKTESSRRPVKIPMVLQPLLAAMAAGKEPGDPLFPGTLGGRRRRQWLWAQVQRLCALVGIPAVCVHALRGTMASAAAAAGELPEIVAKVLGHTDSRMTLQHYILPGTAQAAELERGLAAFSSPAPRLPA